MRLLDKIRGWRVLLSFEIALGERSHVAVSIDNDQPKVDHPESIRFWAFAGARILYEIWRVNPPQAFLPIDFLARILRRGLDPATNCFERAELPHIRYVASVPIPTERIIGQDPGRAESERAIRFLTDLPFEGDTPSPLLMVSSLALLQCVVERLEGNPRSLHTLSETGRFIIANFGLQEWARERSKQRLPRAAVAWATSPAGKR